MTAISHPLIAHDAADSIWRAAKGIHEGNSPEIQLNNIRVAIERLQLVANWARKTGTYSYVGNPKVRTQLINAAGGISMCIDQLIELTKRLDTDITDVDAIMKLMLLRTVIKTVQFAPALDEVKVLSDPDRQSKELLKSLGSVEAEPAPEIATNIFGHPAPTTDPLSEDD